MLGCWQSFGGLIGFSNKFLFCKLYVHPTKSEKIYTQDYLQANISQQKGLLEESDHFKLIFNRAICYYYSKDIQVEFVNFLYANVNFPSMEA